MRYQPSIHSPPLPLYRLEADGGSGFFSSRKFDNYFLQAQRIRKRVRDDFDRAFRMPNVLSPLTSPSHTNTTTNEEDKVDFLIHPTTIHAPPLLPSPPQQVMGYVQDVLTAPASLAGVPVVSVPCGVGYHLGGQGGRMWGPGEGEVERAEETGDRDGVGWPVGASVVGQWGGDEGVLRVAKVIERCVRDIEKRR